MWDNQAAYAYSIEEFVYYTGEVIDNPRWCTQDQFCLTTGDPKFPFRVIDKDRVFGAMRKKKTESKVKVVTVQGSKPGQSYLVTVDGKNSSCTCVGFGYRRDCKHVREALAA